ncbi:unnamed protein product [Trifolium pratense]|uniref:Uncharacterized protein n=1 Tax=Trifolium pratense TaxID=57577 RepID=A0ACB0LHM4_TRIPR|nr:unnamed protein product [Trifolium pratense]
MQMRRNMTAIIKFVYVMTLFLSLFHVVTSYFVRHKCKSDYHCQDKLCTPPQIGKCLNNFCYCRIGKKEPFVTYN